MNKETFLILCFALWMSLIPETSHAQLLGPFRSIYEGMSQNAVTSLSVSGDTVWIGPGLNSKIGGSEVWRQPIGADSLLSSSGRVFSLEVKPGIIVAGIGKTLEIDGGTQPASVGTYTSNNGGMTWIFNDFLLDSQPQTDCTPGSSEFGGCDTTFTYGGQSYSRIRVTTPVQSPPYELDVYDQTIIAAHWASGILRSQDLGQHWERLYLPPTTSSEMVPEKSYRWSSQLSDGTITDRYDPRYDTNLLGFGVLIDHSQQVWAGTAGGINVSDNALFASTDSVRWRHIRYTGETDGLAGNWIIRIRQRPSDQSVWMTNWPASGSGEEYGIVVTKDNGLTFKKMLQGIKINDIGFINETIYAVGEAVYQSLDEGKSWREIRSIETSTDKIPGTTEFYSVGSSSKGLYIGSSQGLLYTENDGYSWELYRTQFPLDGGNQYSPNANSVEAYAYPNPFSPSRHEWIRVRFNANKSGVYSLEIYDASMNPVKKLTSEVSQSGEYEFEWNGRNSLSQFVHNGVYIGLLKGPAFSSSVKILLLD